MWPTNKNAAYVRIERKQDWIIQALIAMHTEEQQFMAQVQIDDAKLAALQASLADIASKLAAEIASLKSSNVPLAAADTSAIDAQVAALQALEVPAPPAA
jgi:hypothetical protein